MFGVRNPDDPKYASLNAVHSNESATAAADVVALCTPWQGTQQAVASCGELAGKVVIDCTNPLTADFSALEIGLTASGAEQIASWAPGARVCKAMNAVCAAVDPSGVAPRIRYQLRIRPVARPILNT
jgi:8-hydroxy-5-deazaflavin:NADPH oxidoreductase